MPKGAWDQLQVRGQLFLLWKKGDIWAWKVSGQADFERSLEAEGALHRGIEGQRKFKEIQETAVTKIPGAIDRKMGQIVKSLDSASQSLDFILWVAGNW